MDQPAGGHFSLTAPRFSREVLLRLLQLEQPLSQVYQSSSQEGWQPFQVGRRSCPEELDLVVLKELHLVAPEALHLVVPEELHLVDPQELGVVAPQAVEHSYQARMVEAHRGVLERQG
jgi:hypothetical protein